MVKFNPLSNKAEQPVPAVVVRVQQQQQQQQLGEANGTYYHDVNVTRVPSTNLVANFITSSEHILFDLYDSKRNLFAQVVSRCAVLSRSLQSFVNVEIWKGSVT